MNLRSSLRRNGGNTCKKMGRKVTTTLVLVRMRFGHRLWVALTRATYVEMAKRAQPAGLARQTRQK